MALLNGFKEKEAEQQYRRGEIYYINNASKEHIGSEMKKDRPLIVSEDDVNVILDILEREIFQTLEELSEYDPLKIDKDTTSQILEEMDEEEDEDESE